MNHKELTNQINLLKEYIKTLQQQNKAKNAQRQTIYNQLDMLSNENTNLLNELNHLRQQWQNRQLYFQQMQVNFPAMRSDLDNLVKILQEKDSQIGNFKYQQEKDAERIIWLEELLRDMKVKQGAMKQELAKIKEQYKFMAAKLQQSSQMWHNDQRINQLIENYQKIQELAKQKDKQNQNLRQENLYLNQQLVIVRNALAIKQKQLSAIKKTQKKQSDQKQNHKQKDNVTFFSVSKSKLKQTQKQQKLNVSQQIFNSINLVRQNNKLIEKVTQLQKQKNIIYAEVYQSIWKGQVPCESQIGLNPVKILSCISNTWKNSQSQKIRERINQLKQENVKLLENLKI